MGIVYKPEPMPPPGASFEEKKAWYLRERARAVATMERQRAAFPFLPPPPPYPPQPDEPIKIGSYNGFGYLICGLAFLAAVAAYCLTHPH